MRYALVMGISLFAGVTLFSNYAAAQVDEEKLLKDSSRADRFKLIKREAAKELGLDIGGLSADVVKRFSFPGDADDESVYGIDLSHHNEDGCKCTVDWSHVGSQRVSFAYLKATQGATGQDARFAKNWSALETSGIRRGAYHFLSPFSTPEDQVKNFLKTMGTLRASDLPPVMDIEWTDAANPENDGWIAKSADDIVDFALKWLTAVEAATGRIPVIYTSRAWWKDRITDAKLAKFQRYPIWIAQYVPDSNGQILPKNLPAEWSWKIWQFTESGGISGGLSSQVDVSVFKGTLDQFHQAFGVTLPISTPMPTPTSMPPPVAMPSDGTQNSSGAPPASAIPADASKGANPNTAAGTSGAPPLNGKSASDAPPVPKPPAVPKSDGGNGIGLGGNPYIRME